MNGKESFGRRLENFFAGKGFYIVLFACVFVIGISAWSLFSAGVFSPSRDDAPVDVNTGSFSDFSPPDSEVTEHDLEERPVSVWNGPITDKTKEVNPEIAEPSNKPEIKQEPPVEVPETDKPAVSPSPAALEFSMPVRGEVVTGFSPDELVYNKTLADWRVHTGIDIAAAIGTKVTAAADGTVKKVYSDDMFGTTVVIDHGDGIMSIYSNLAKTPTVSEGDRCSGGDVIGAVGDTAIGETGEVAHLHFAMEKDGDVCDPFDYLPKN